MNRIFGAKNTAPKPTLQGAIGNLESRVESIDVQLSKLNAELATYQQRLSKMRDGPGKNAIKQKALKVLQRRKMYESQKDQLQQQSWNMEQAGMMQDNLKSPPFSTTLSLFLMLLFLVPQARFIPAVSLAAIVVVVITSLMLIRRCRECARGNGTDVMVTVDALKTTNKELKKQYGKINIDKIEQLQDEMADLMDIGNDIQESMSRSYDIPEDVDEAELDAELEALGEEVELGSGGWEAETMGETPSFLQGEGVPDFVDEAPLGGHKVREAV
ncbi:Vacuolar protein-sorting-associated protein 60 [Maublancomyces gigas]|uniref:Vacuolar protein-sorting-associated protein 60 n=1 Tax=Discina gigas TaxID=1032678 RepID=A0ABR3GIL8_9PEZI